MNEPVNPNLEAAVDPRQALSRYIRQPQIYITLPSGGKYWPAGSLEMPINGEIPVLSMSSYDELVLKTPDALMNGQSVVDIIQSCIRNIKDAWAMPVVDLDYCLIAIRIASYGESMGFTSTCTGCGEWNEYNIDLKNFLNLPVDMARYEKIVEYDNNLKIKIKPRSYRDANQANLEVFEQQRIVNIVQDDSMDEQTKQQKFNEVFKRLTSLSLANIIGSVEYIEIDGTKVTQKPIIEEFIANTDLKVYRKIQEHHNITQEVIPDKTVKTTCPECNHSYEIPFTFDHANFFALAS